MNVIAILCAPPLSEEGRRAAIIAREAIGLFIEFRNMHGQDEATALESAVNEIAEGYSAAEDEMRHGYLFHQAVPVDERERPDYDGDELAQAAQLRAAAREALADKQSPVDEEPFVDLPF